MAGYMSFWHEGHMTMMIIQCCLVGIWSHDGLTQ